MIRFLDGPAKGEIMRLVRAPDLLRVVSDGKKWDALDRLDDEPKAEEAVHVYFRVTEVTQVHIHARKRAESGWYLQADYRHLPVQPTGSAQREIDAWRTWCRRTGKYAMERARRKALGVA